MRWPLLAVACLLLAGCSGHANEPMAPEEPAVPGDVQALGLEATPTSGLVHGYVVDPALRPLDGVRVQLLRLGEPLQQATTDQDGAWGFDGLDPGSYGVAATLAGYLQAQTVVEVHADDDDPAPVRLVLDPDTEGAPYAIAVSFDGFITCGVRGGTGGVSCGAVSQARQAIADRSELFVPVDPAPDWVQAEMLWEKTQPLADQMGLYLHRIPQEGNDQYMGIYPLNQGVSPVVVAVDSSGVGLCSTCIEPPLNMTGWQTLQVSARTGELTSTTPPTTCAPTGSPCLTGLGASVQQQFRVYVHVLYRAQPPDGWRFSTDGPPF